jgi:hypothetical protein
MNDFLQRQFINQSQSAAGLWTLDKPNSQLLNSGRGTSRANHIRPKMNFIPAYLTRPELRNPSSNAVHQALSRLIPGNPARTQKTSNSKCFHRFYTHFSREKNR